MTKLPSIVSKIAPDLRAFLDRVREILAAPVSNLADAVISTAKLIDKAVTTAKLADKAVITEKLADGAATADKVGELPASKVTSGTFDVARIPDLAASKITSSTFDAARIPSLNASKITTGTFALALLPQVCDLIVSGTDSGEAVGASYNDMVFVTTTGVTSSTKVLIVGVVTGYAARPFGTAGFGLLARLRRGTSTALVTDQYVTYSAGGYSGNLTSGGSRVIVYVETISSSQTYYLDMMYNGAATSGGCTDAALFVFRLR